MQGLYCSTLHYQLQYPAIPAVLPTALCMCLVILSLLLQLGP
jgi:hypothetical protein